MGSVTKAIYMLFEAIWIENGDDEREEAKSLTRHSDTFYFRASWTELSVGAVL